jgi:hypothetical protein
MNLRRFPSTWDAIDNPGGQHGARVRPHNVILEAAMKLGLGFLLVASLLLSACTPAVDVTQTAAAQTQAFENDMATALAGTSTAMAPTSTPTSPPATATATATATPTQVPSPTPSGKFDFFDVTVTQVNDNMVEVAFGFQMDKKIKSDALYVGARPLGCKDSQYKTSFRPFIVGGAQSGLVTGDKTIQVQLRQPASCAATGISLFVFVPNSASGDYFHKDFDIPFSLEMK